MYYITMHLQYITLLQADKWKEKFFAANRELKLLQVSRTILAKIKAVSFLKPWHVLTSVWISLSSSTFRIPLRAHVSFGFAHTHKLCVHVFMCVHTHADVRTRHDNVQKPAWCVYVWPMSWTCTCNCLPVPCTMHVDRGIAAPPGPDVCGNCRRDFSKEYEDDSEGIMEAKEESGIPPSEEMVVP